MYNVSVILFVTADFFDIFVGESKLLFNVLNGMPSLEWIKFPCDFKGITHVELCLI